MEIQKVGEKIRLIDLFQILASFRATSRNNRIQTTAINRNNSKYHNNNNNNNNNNYNSIKLVLTSPSLQTLLLKSMICLHRSSSHLRSLSTNFSRSSAEE